MLELLVIVVCLLPVLVLVIAGVNHSRINRLKEKVHRLESAIATLQSQMARLPGGGAVPPSPASARPAGGGAVEHPSIPEPGPLPAAPPVAAPPPAAAAPPPVHGPAPSRKAAPSRTREELEMLVGGKLLNRIGALALILAAGFFLKYAFDNDLINETARVLLGGVLGCGLLVAAARSRKKGLEVFSQGLVGAGIAILYLSVFASFNFYDLLPQGVAYALMTVVTIVAVVHAFRYHSFAVALLAWAGGFLTPVMLAVPDPNMVGLLSYLALLAAGFLAVTLLRPAWSVLDLLTLIAVHAHFLSWYADHYQPGDLWRAVYFAVLYWALFAGFELYRLRRLPAAGREAREVTGAFNALVTFAWLHVLIDPGHHDLMPWVTLALAAVYAAAGLLAARGAAGEKGASARHAVTAAGFVAAAVAIRHPGHMRFILWAGEALALAWLGVWRNAKHLRVAGIALIVFAAASFLLSGGLFSVEVDEAFRPLWNDRAAALAAMAAAAAGMAVLLGRRNPQGPALPLHSLWTLLLLILVSTEVWDLFRWRILLADSPEAEERLRYLRLMAMGSAWTALSLPLVWTGLRAALRPVLLSGYAFLAFGVLLCSMNGFVFEPIGRFVPLANARAAVLAGTVLACVFHLRMVAGAAAGEWKGTVGDVLRVVAPLLLLELVTSEGWDFFRAQKLGVEEGTADFVRLSNLQQLAFSATWVFFSVGLMGVGLWRRSKTWRVMAIVLFGFAILKIFLYDLSFLDTLYRFVSFGVLGVILLATSYLYTRYKSVIFGAAEPLSGDTGEQQAP